jgi:hypothetical protein
MHCYSIGAAFGSLGVRVKRFSTIPRFLHKPRPEITGNMFIPGLTRFPKVLYSLMVSGTWGTL